MTEYYISYALHVRGEAGLDGSGAMRTADEFPDYDTLIAIKNTSRAQTASLRIEFHDQAGSPVLWGVDGVQGDSAKSYDLKPNHSFAMTLIRPNPFPDTPNNFIGSAVIDCSAMSSAKTSPELVVYAALGGGGKYPSHWNTIGAELPVFTSDEGKRMRQLVSKKDWFLAYSIPFFKDANHREEHYQFMRPGYEKDILRDHSYRTGLVATNYDNRQVSLHFEYCINDHYSEGGRTFSFEKTVPARGTIVFPTHQALEEAGLRAGTSSEGSWRIQADRKAKVVIWALHSDGQFRGWSCGQVAL
jgi:hypothetical protein